MSFDDPNAARTSAPVTAIPLNDAIHSTSSEILATVSANPALTEEHALALLKRNDLPGEAIDQLSKNGSLMKSRKVKLAVVEHAKTPRHVSIPMVRHLFTFDLMHVALAPAVPADIKMAAEGTLISRLETISQGERLSLAHRASGRVAGALLLDPEPRVIHAALENPRLTESEIVMALVHRDATGTLIRAVCHHSKWSPSREVRIALLRNEETPSSHAIEFARTLPAGLLREILEASPLPEATKRCLLNDAKRVRNPKGKPV